MRIFNLGRVRIARALVAVLFLTLIQSIALPVLTSVTMPQAMAVDANDFPSGLGTVYQYVADSYTSGATTGQRRVVVLLQQSPITPPR